MNLRHRLRIAQGHQPAAGLCQHLGLRPGRTLCRPARLETAHADDLQRELEQPFLWRPRLAWVLVPLFGLAYGTCQAVFFSLAMGVVDSRIAASMYSILMAITNIAQGVGMAMTGISADRLDFRMAFVIGQRLEHH